MTSLSKLHNYDKILPTGAGIGIGLCLAIVGTLEALNIGKYWFIPLGLYALYLISIIRKEYKTEAKE